MRHPASIRQLAGSRNLSIPRCALAAAKTCRQRCRLPGRERSGSLIVSHDRLASPCRGSGSRSRPQAAKRWRASATALTDCRWSGLFAPSGLARHRRKVERMALGSLISLMSSEKCMAGRFLRRLLNLNSHNHNQRGRRRRFYLAVLIERPTSAPRCEISLLRNRAPHVSPHVIHARANRSRMRRLVAADPSRPLKTVRLGIDADHDRTAS